MDCLTFRRIIITDPATDEQEVVEHLAECEQCRSFRRELGRFNSALEYALKVPVSESLRAKILLRQSSKPTWLGTWRIASVLAACCLIAIAIGVRIEAVQSPERWLSAVKHYMDQPIAPRDLAATISHQDVNKILNRIGVQLDDNIGHVAFAVPCVIGNRHGAHLVVAGDNGPVTVLIMPAAEIKNSIEFQTPKTIGVIAPCPRGSIAVIGDATERIGIFRSRFERAITFI